MENREQIRKRLIVKEADTDSFKRNCDNVLGLEKECQDFFHRFTDVKLSQLGAVVIIRVHYQTNLPDRHIRLSKGCRSSSRKTHTAICVRAGLTRILVLLRHDEFRREILTFVDWTTNIVLTRRLKAGFMRFQFLVRCKLIGQTMFCHFGPFRFVALLIAASGGVRDGMPGASLGRREFESRVESANARGATSI